MKILSRQIVDKGHLRNKFMAKLKKATTRTTLEHHETETYNVHDNRYVEKKRYTHTPSRRRWENMFPNKKIRYKRGGLLFLMSSILWIKIEFMTQFRLFRWSGDFRYDLDSRFSSFLLRY